LSPVGVPIKKGPAHRIADSNSRHIIIEISDDEDDTRTVEMDVASKTSATMVTQPMPIVQVSTIVKPTCTVSNDAVIVMPIADPTVTVTKDAASQTDAVIVMPIAKDATSQTADVTQPMMVEQAGATGNPTVPQIIADSLVIVEACAIANPTVSKSTVSNRDSVLAPLALAAIVGSSTYTAPATLRDTPQSPLETGENYRAYTGCSVPQFGLCHILTDLANIGASCNTELELQQRIANSDDKRGVLTKSGVLKALRTRAAGNTGISEIASVLLLVLHTPGTKFYNRRCIVFQLLTGYGRNWWHTHGLLIAGFRHGAKQLPAALVKAEH
jgi:hypothetical protein